MRKLQNTKSNDTRNESKPNTPLTIQGYEAVKKRYEEEDANDSVQLPTGYDTFVPRALIVNNEFLKYDKQERKRR